jgi:hypothetical protein
MHFAGFKGCFDIFEESLAEKRKISLKLSFRASELDNFGVRVGEDCNLMIYNFIDTANKIGNPLDRIHHNFRISARLQSKYALAYE